MPHQLLSQNAGEYVDERDTMIESLHQEVRDLKMQVHQARAELAQTQKANALAIATLRSVLSPLYRGLQQVFGEMESVGGGDIQGGNNPKWDAIKQRLAPRLREAVDLLLIQRSMKRTQLAAALKMDYSNCTKNVIGALLRQGLLVDNGGQLSLKEL